MGEPNVTRGYGLLEGFLARQRGKMADRLIPETSRSGRLLDIGCGSYPLFLVNTVFANKFGIDKMSAANAGASDALGEIRLVNHDVEADQRLPFPDNFFTVVTMLAVFEHIEPDRLARLLQEVRRALMPGGVYILTTPAAWTDRLLRLMAKLRLVSPAEIEEHKDAYTHAKVFDFLLKADFSKEKIQMGYFEFYLNIWATAVK